MPAWVAIAPVRTARLPSRPRNRERPRRRRPADASAARCFRARRLRPARARIPLCRRHLPLNSGTLFAMTGARPQGEPGGRGALIRERRRLRNSFLIKDLPMSSTFDAVANIIAETCDIPRDTIKPESHAINDLGIDSLDFLDVAFAIDKAFGIKMPLEQWTQEVNEGKATTEQYFVLKNLCAHIDALVVAKGA
jgi:acyl carrier protein